MNIATEGDEVASPSAPGFRLAICGGGSGGHLTPGIAVAEEIERRTEQFSVAFLTSGRDVDHQVLQTPLESHESWTQEALPIFGRGRLKTVAETLSSVFAARRKLKTLKPQVVLGTGGFASVPGILAAATLKIPVFLLESNVVPGRANRTLNRFSTATFCGLPMQNRFRENWSSEIRQVGVPVRTHFLNTDEVATSQPATVLILGGSQGATGLNQLVVSALRELTETSADFRIVHQTGKTDVDSIRNDWGPSANVEVVPYIDDPANEIRRSSVVISRAGAVTMAEIAACGRPAIFVPLPNSADEHQLANAEYFSNHGAAIVVGQLEENAAELLRDATLKLLRDHESTGKESSRSMNGLAKPEAVREIVSRLLQYSSS